MNIENMKIISIDDNKTNLLIIESYAKILKLNISSFLNPLDAVDELEKNDYDLIKYLLKINVIISSKAS